MTMGRDLGGLTAERAGVAGGGTQVNPHLQLCVVG